MTDSYDLLISAAPEPKPDLDIVDTWQRAIGADPSHPYLTRYGLPRQSLRQIGDYLVAPLTDRRGRLIGLRLVDADGVEDIYPASAAKACFAMERDGATTTIIVQGSVADAVAIHASMAARVLLVPTTRDALQLHEQLIAEKLGYAVRVAFSSQALAAASCAVGEQNPAVVASPSNLTWAGLYALQGAAGVASWIDGADLWRREPAHASGCPGIWPLGLFRQSQAHAAGRGHTRNRPGPRRRQETLEARALFPRSGRQ